MEQIQPQPPPPAPTQARYQLFPRERQLPVLNSAKAAEAERSNSPSLFSYMDDSFDEVPTPSALRTKITQHSMTRRRKVSVPEIGPMTTVQEVPMDSPTIPGRPPLHERSISAPAQDWKPSPPESLPSPVPLAEETAQAEPQEKEKVSLTQTLEEKLKTCTSMLSRAASTRKLAPLVIPHPGSHSAALHQQTLAHNRSGSVPNEAYKPRKTAVSPYLRTPFTPSISMTDLTSPYSTSTHAASTMTLPTPVSAPVSETYRASPRPWEGRSQTPTLTGRAKTPQPVATQQAVVPHGHRRGASESATSIMDRGRPRKRLDQTNRPALGQSEESAGQSIERKAFEELPTGVLPKDASVGFKADDMMAIHKHARRQAERFEVLGMSDVEALSKELRRLDERTEYLRRTYTSLRAGRRNLQGRLCQFLRSPRAERLSFESMLRQEEALAELDTSIDEWVQKLEMAENRRTRIRQKLLEHVAAAGILGVPGDAATPSPREQPPPAAVMQSPAGFCDISTPPRSPTKQAPVRRGSISPSPQRVVVQVPSMILEDPPLEDADTEQKDQLDAEAQSLRRTDVESIRIYAGDDVAWLLADVESEITRLSQSLGDPAPKQHGNWVAAQAQVSELKSKQLHLQRSHEQLSGISFSSTPATMPHKGPRSATPESPPAPPPPIKDYPRSNSPSSTSSMRP
ncbi:uncharacterized protein J7T54_005535 [Emericellopsis cladophorae]|uniref:Up-regulated during septation protein 1 domain-containing protein n=1 Tax=Emericellopsis cladophorae TaxID=2686198 RepID=A0A9P9Y4U3_9HYPO|nr:uncharacterized protein J7T54_005535 [Emericellopsis cladophorae]KAI6783506.1 hypothetical protein J7T54_005535 [Emericellopsis cladophorae]